MVYYDKQFGIIIKLYFYHLIIRTHFLLMKKQLSFLFQTYSQLIQQYIPLYQFTRRQLHSYIHFVTNLINLTNCGKGLFQQKKCPKGRNCNFLHVFRDPNGMFLDSTPHCADVPVVKSRQWRWSESPPPQSNKTGDKTKRRLRHNSSSKSKSESISKRVKRRSRLHENT